MSRFKMKVQDSVQPFVLHLMILWQLVASSKSVKPRKEDTIFPGLITILLLAEPVRVAKKSFPLYQVELNLWSKIRPYQLPFSYMKVRY